MKGVSLASRWEIVAALLCAALTAVPGVRLPAGLVLLCVLPGAAFCRHWLGERSPIRILILGSVFSLAVVPAIAIPAALLAGRPTPSLAAAAACVATLAGCLGGRAGRSPARPPVTGSWGLAAIMGAALLLQAGFGAALHPADGVVQWKGMPDMIFFQGIYEQLSRHTPPLDPDAGGSLLVHNWIYHFHFALVHVLTGLPIPLMTQVVSAWMTLVLLGCVWLAVTEILREGAAAAALACLFLLTSGEVTWIAQSLSHLALTFGTPPWERCPLGRTLLIGWYNVAPMAAGLAAWYWFERHRAEGGRPELWASVALCVAMAFFHPVLFGAFMTGFCLWMIFLALRGQARLSWLAFLATPLPFFLLYKLPYYGLASTPKVVSLDLHLGGLAARAQELVLWGGIVLAMGVPALALMGVAAGPLLFIAGVLLLMEIVLAVPNPHWIHDWLYIALAIASAVLLIRLLRRSAWAGSALAVATLTLSAVAFGLHLEASFRLGHAYTIEERAAAAWIRDQTDPDDLFATIPNDPSIYTVVGLGHRRVAHGWTTHLLDFHHDAKEREKAIEDLFRTDDPRRAAEVASRFGVHYLFLDRRSLLEEPAAAVLRDPRFERVFAAGTIEVRRFDPSAERAAVLRADAPPVAD